MKKTFTFIPSVGLIPMNSLREGALGRFLTNSSTCKMVLNQHTIHSYRKQHTPSFRTGLLILFLLCGFSFLAADSFTFRADRVSGSRALGRETTILTGNAEVRSDSLLLRADRIEIQGNNNEFVDCIGNVWGYEEDKDILFYTDRLRYDRQNKIARLTGNSTLEDRKNDIVARGRFIEYDDPNEMAIFEIAVRLFKDDMVCRSEYAIYNRKEKLLDLTGFPIVYKKDDEFNADRIRVDLETDDVMMEGSVSGTISN